MSVFMICERAIGLMRGNRLMLTETQRELLEALDYEGLADTLITRGPDEALSCVRHFAAVRDRLTAAYPWVCARASTMPARLEQARKNWEYTYALPNDCVKVLSMTTNETYAPRTVERWEVWGNTISCRYPIAELRYSRRMTDTDEWSPLFEDAFVFSLAAEISAGITGETAAYANFEQGARLRIQEAERCGEIKKPLSVEVEMYGFHKFSDTLDPRYGSFEE